MPSGSAEPRARWLLPPGTWPLACFYALFFAVAGAALPYLPVYLLDAGLRPADIGAALAVGIVTKVVSPYLGAWLAERLGDPLALVRVGLVGGLLSWLIFGAVPQSFWWLAAALLLYNFFMNGVLPQFEVLTLDRLRGREADYGAIRLWGSAGFVLAVLGTGALTARLGIARLEMIVAALLAALVGISFWIRALAPRYAARTPTVGADDGSSAISLRDVLRQPAVIGFLVAIFCLQASHGPYYTFFTIQLESAGYSREQAAWFWVLGVIAEIGLFAAAPRLLRRWTGEQLFLCCAGVTTLRWLLTGAFADSLVVLLFAQLLHAVTFGLYHAAGVHIVRSRFSGALQGRGQALYSAVGFGIGGGLGGLASGFLWESVGPFGSYLSAAAAAGIATLVLWLCRFRPAANI
ncbi:MAG: MFS transporter [Pseudomonadota bacterium]